MFTELPASVRPWAGIVVITLLAGVLPGAAPPPAAAADPPPPSAATASTRVLAVSAGSEHTCAIRTDGTLACWGDNWNGQATPPAGTFTAVSAGGAHTCAIKTDDTLACWGYNEYGQATPPAGTFTAVSAGQWHACAIKTDDTLACWGNDGDVPATPPAGTFSAVSTGTHHTCAIRTDGTLGCWGDEYGQTTPPGGTFTAVSAGYLHTCAIGSGDTLACWGANEAGQATPPAGTFSAVGAGNSHTCAIRTDGTLACWGANDYGQATPPAGTLSAVDTGGGHTCALKTDGTLACWGDNEYGQAIPRPDADMAPLAAWRTTKKVALRWSARPALAPVVSYDIQYRRAPWNGGLGDAVRWRTATTASSATFTGTPGNTYCFAVRARDADGQVSAWHGSAAYDSDEAETHHCTAIPLDDRSLARSSGWTGLRDARFYRSTGLRTSTNGAKLSLSGLARVVGTSLSGARVAIVATKCPTCGTVRVYWVSRDNWKSKKVSLYAPTRVDRAVIPVFDFPHEYTTRNGATLTIKVMSSGKKVIIDGVSVHWTFW